MKKKRLPPKLQSLIARILTRVETEGVYHIEKGSYGHAVLEQVLKEELEKGL